MKYSQVVLFILVSFTSLCSAASEDHDLPLYRRDTSLYQRGTAKVLAHDAAAGAHYLSELYRNHPEAVGEIAMMAQELLSGKPISVRSYPGLAHARRTSVGGSDRYSFHSKRSPAKIPIPKTLPKSVPKPGSVKPPPKVQPPKAAPPKAPSKPEPKPPGKPESKPPGKPETKPPGKTDPKPPGPKGQPKPSPGGKEVKAPTRDDIKKQTADLKTCSKPQDCTCPKVESRVSSCIQGVCNCGQTDILKNADWKGLEIIDKTWKTAQVIEGVGKEILGKVVPGGKQLAEVMENVIPVPHLGDGVTGW